MTTATAETLETLTAGTFWNQNSNYRGATRYAAERGHHAAVAAGNYWVVSWDTPGRGRTYSVLSAHGLALGLAKDLVHNPGAETVLLGTVVAGELVRVADNDGIAAARY